MHPVAAAGFASAADVYERARPSYPQEAIDWLAARTGLGPGSVVVDVGAGTGKLTRLLGATGARVVAVEPLAEMRAKIAMAATAVEALDGTAEALPLPDASADVITVAQAFHWFDHARALPELHRVLRDGGWLALVWNNRDTSDPLQRAVEDLLMPLRSGLPGQKARAWYEPLVASSLFGDVEEARFRYEQQFTADDLCDRVASTSFVAAMPARDRRALLEQVRELTNGLAEPFPFPYVTEIQLIPRSSDGGGRDRGNPIKG